LLRVGIDNGCGRALAPIFDDGSFEFVPILESIPAPDAAKYNDMIGRNGKRLSAYVPSSRENPPKVKGKREKDGKIPSRRLHRAPSP